jgi:hypothetical protein
MLEEVRRGGIKELSTGGCGIAGEEVGLRGRSFTLSHMR